MDITSITTEQLKDFILDAQRYLLRVPAVQTDLMRLEEELAKRNKDKASSPVVEAEVVPS